ncbi:21650_t:CDS:2 [Cetraspora pellucida]|uniref:21650_t:CDS:1 n=1 Tax=Cetraspora pellucida TaxID=1433469 RepID=A0A9N9F2U8_9GLOM|nr:21650_t:CDS:2 [Cetraspora pellucida]
MVNIKSELTCFERELTEAELREIVNSSTVGKVMALESDDDMVDSDELSYAEIEQETLVIDDIVDLTQNYLECEREMLNTNNDYNLQAGNMSYSPEDLVATQDTTYNFCRMPLRVTTGLCNGIAVMTPSYAHASHPIVIRRHQVLSLYRNILKESSNFFDDNAKIFLKNRTRKRFKEYKDETDETRILNKLADARQALSRLKRANVFDIKSVTRVLELTYGRRGPMRHQLLKPIINEPSEAPKPIVRGFPRTAPPRMSPSLQTLLLSQTKTLYPTLPVPKHKPLYPSRKANLLWRHYSKIMKTVMPPVDDVTLDQLEKNAGKGILTGQGVANRCIPSRNHNDEQNRLRTLRNTGTPKSPRDPVKEGPYRTAKPHNPRPRFIRRLYQRLLTKIPVMKEGTESTHLSNFGPDTSGNQNNCPSTITLPNKRNKRYIIIKSSWADGRPLPLVNHTDWQGLDPVEVAKLIDDKKTQIKKKVYW